MDHILTFLVRFPSIGLFVLLILGGVGLPFPEDATLIACGFLISQEFLRPAPALIVVYAGLLCADSLVYHFGKKYGRSVIEHPRFHRFLSPAALAKLEEQF